MMKHQPSAETCCGEPAVKQTTSASEASCCTPEAMETCCGSQVKSPPASTPRAERIRLEIDFLYLDLSACERCQGTDSILKAALEEVAQVLETTGVEVALNNMHVTSEEQAVVLGFLVSPTIRMNGRDIQMNFRESLCESCGTLCECEGGVSCREWEYQGQWYTAPPKGLIIEAILKEVYGGAREGRDESHKAEEVPDNLKRFFSARRVLAGER